MYGRAEQTTASCSRERPARRGLRRDQGLDARPAGRHRADGESSRRWARERIDLMQVHNLVDWRTHLATLRELEGRGPRALRRHHPLHARPSPRSSRAARRELDFLQINYALDDREVEHACCRWRRARRGGDRQLPFGGGGLLRRLPTAAARLGRGDRLRELGAGPPEVRARHPAVTCAIPGTRRREHMADNARAGVGMVPPPAFWNDKVDAVAR